MASGKHTDGILNAMERPSVESVEARTDNRRRLTVGSSEKGCFDQLPEALIEEILIRLPLRSVFRLRCVSKGWLFRTTSPNFVRLFERRHYPSGEGHPVGLLLQDSMGNNKKQFVVCSGVPEFNSSGFSLQFLPGLRGHGYDPISILGSCDDLLLCSNQAWFQSKYFIVNFVTWEWVALPPPRQVHKSVLTGFVCDPTTIPEGKTGSNLRYRVVRILDATESATELSVEIFSSEYGRWNEYTMTCAAGLKTDQWCRRAVACNGSLYWKFLRRGEKIVALDPFHPRKKEFDVIDNPPESFDVELKADHIGIHRGNLRMSQTLHSVHELYEPSRLHIWELEEGRVWRSVKEASLATIVATNSSYAQLRRSSGWGRGSWVTLAVHPNEGDIVYFGCTRLNKIICCNLKTNSLQIMCDYDLSNWSAYSGTAFPIVQPWWPTPVLALPKL